MRRYAFESVSVMSGRVWIRAPQDSPEPYVLATVTSTDGNAIYSVHVDGVERHVVLEQDAWLANEDGDGPKNRRNATDSDETIAKALQEVEDEASFRRYDARARGALCP